MHGNFPLSVKIKLELGSELGLLLGLGFLGVKAENWINIIFWDIL